jgi:hypothetical protein
VTAQAAATQVSGAAGAPRKASSEAAAKAQKSRALCEKREWPSGQWAAREQVLRGLPHISAQPRPQQLPHLAGLGGAPGGVRAPLAHRRRRRLQALRRLGPHLCTALHPAGRKDNIKSNKQERGNRRCATCSCWLPRLNQTTPSAHCVTPQEQGITCWSPRNIDRSRHSGPAAPTHPSPALLPLPSASRKPSPPPRMPPLRT